MANIDSNFVSLHTLCPKMQIHVSYATSDNFTGQIVQGYRARKAYLIKTAAEALGRVQIKALEAGHTLKIFDAYRPAKAVAFFQNWAKLPETNPHIKEKFYPKYSRTELFEKGYLAKQSSHSRGCTVDLTLVQLSTNLELDMGSEFDFFDDLSYTESTKISKSQFNNRMILKNLMEAEGFKNYSQEWWHYTFRPEPFPEKYFDFDVE